MGLPNMSRTVKRFSIPAKLIKVTKTIVNHKPVESEVETESTFKVCNTTGSKRKA